MFNKVKVTKSDVAQILPAISREADYRIYVRKKVREEVEKIKSKITEQFNNHPVTLELEQGISANNISGTLNGITNLYSFIGFNQGYDPISPIRSELNKIKLNESFSMKGTIRYTIDFPTAKDIFNITPLPWAIGRSWAKGIERGLSGLGYYIRGERVSSRSGSGIQSSKKVLSGARFKNTKYISALINTYIDDIKKLEKLILWFLRFHII